MSAIPEITVRTCTSFDELDACVLLQVQTWGYDPADVIPRRLFVVAQHIGGQVVGAFRKGEKDGVEQLVGFVMALPGGREGRAYLHSHMLAVLPEYRNRGLGRRLKFFQREEALARGIDRMEWTFDPLEIKNAYFNIAKLGAIVRTYWTNFYGVSSARLQGGRPTDRLLATWNLNSPRVRVALAGGNPPRGHVEERIMLPAAVMAWKESAEKREKALALQLENRERFQDAFRRGLCVTGFSRDVEGNGCFELGRCE